jgi:hypothetical protein
MTDRAIEKARERRIAELQAQNARDDRAMHRNHRRLAALQRMTGADLLKYVLFIVGLLGLVYWVLSHQF